VGGGAAGGGFGSLGGAGGFADAVDGGEEKADQRHDDGNRGQ
jgi:hypothetical protein